MPKSEVPTATQLSTAKQQLLAQWQRGQAQRLPVNDGAANGHKNGVATSQVIPRRVQQEHLPLSFAQQRLWFLDQMGAGANYNMPMALRLTGRLDVAALQQALREIVCRHESLRTIFRQQGTRVEQIVQADAPFVLPLVDLSAAADPLAAAHQHAHAEAAQPFDLSHDRLLRAQLLQLGSEEHVLLLTLHHIAGDGWSLGLLMQELRALYAAVRQDQPSPLPPLTLQYADFALWQQAQLQGERAETLLAYWREALRDAPPFLPLPMDYPRPAVATTEGNVVRFQLPPALVNALKQLSRQGEATLFMTMLTAFFVLLARYSEQTDVVVGAPLAGRTHHQLEPLIGFFINMLPLRAQVNPDTSFRSLLAQVRNTALAAYEHQEMPFDRLVEALQPERNLSHQPLFQVAFALQNVPPTALALPDLQVTPLRGNLSHSFVDLTLHLFEDGDGLRGLCEYRSDLFAAPTMERLVANYQTLLESVVANPDQAVGNLDLLAAAGRTQVLTAWNATQRPYPQEGCVHHLFEQQTARTPDATAVVYQGQSLTYRQLNERANQLAHLLQKAGVGPEVLVGMAVEYSLDVVVGLLAILKAGGVYLPLDPEHPAERLAAIVEETGVGLLLTQTHLLPKLPTQQRRCLLLDSMAAELAEESCANPVSGVQPGNLVYLLYTSGSTGKPKGIMIEHGGLVNHCYATVDAYRLTSQDRVLQFASYSFDVCMEELFPSWLAGATVVMRPQWPCAVTDLARVIAQEALTVLNLPVGFWHEWVLQLAHVAVPPSVRLVIVGNDKALQERLHTWRQQVGDRVSWRNTYGASEATVATTLYDPVDACPGITDAVPGGRPIANTQIYVLDSAQQPVPIGVPGEIYIGGAGVGRGYWRQPHLTREKFITNPFAPGRLYRTGDRGRFLADGNLEFLGRIDNQVKIRGFRVEPGEIEAVLHQHPQVQQAAVVAQEESSGNKYLVAYLVAHQRLSPKEVRAFVKARLPDYMTPAAFVQLPVLPLSAHGKVDRRALPAPDAASFAMTDYTPPTTATELALADLWRSLLGVKQIGRDDNFFDLGGHSLLVTQLFYHLEKRFGIQLPIQNLFQFPTLAACSAQIDQQLQAPRGTRVEEYKSKAEWLAEMVLDDAIQPPSPHFVTDAAAVQGIFLTGATGFLGAFLLHDLLQTTSATVYCLVRAANHQAASDRLQTTLEQYHLWQPSLRARIVPVVGDLAQPRFGLSAPQFQQLAEQVDLIYHNGAWVNFLYAYATVKAANVLGTQEVLRLAGLVKTKPVHYVSTISVFPGWLECCEEDNPLDFEFYRADDLKLKFGYMTSKWVAEKLLLQARDRGFPVCIYRPSEIAGHSRTGVANLKDAFTREIKSCLQLGIMPDRAEYEENLVPVDYASQAIVHLSLQPTALGKIFHITNPVSNSKNKLFDYAIQRGYHLQKLPFAQWKEAVVAQAKDDPTIALHPLAPLYAQPMDLSRVSKRLDFDCRNTLAELANSNIVCPPVDEALLQTYFTYFAKAGDFPPPGELHNGAPSVKQADQQGEAVVC
jgi:amino acid adenylation domain-containing protein/thioester reductase-like protein